MLFDFHTFIQELRQNKEKNEIIIKYEKIFGPIKGDIKDQLWYKEYVSKFAPFSYSVPSELKTSFDWDLLCTLSAASFSSDCFYLKKDGKEEFSIRVISGETKVKKLVSELWSFQILRLYEIYCDEQINLQILIAENKKEEEAVSLQRAYFLNRWKKQTDSIAIKNYIYSIESEIIALLE